MAFRCEVHDDVGFLRFEDFIDALTVADIGFEELEVGLLEGLLQRREVACIGQTVHAKNTVLGMLFQ